MAKKEKKKKEKQNNIYHRANSLVVFFSKELIMYLLWDILSSLKLNLLCRDFASILEMD